MNKIILTPNKQLARQYRSVDERFRYSKKEAVWETLEIYPLRTWLTLLWNRFCIDRAFLLDEFQEYLLWEKIIAPFNSPYIVEKVQRAWRYSQEWRLPVLNPKWAFSEEIMKFLEWSAIFKRYCQENKLISFVEIIPIFLEKKEIVWPQEIHLFNFDSFSPQVEHFLNKIPSKKIYLETQVPCQDLQRFSFNDNRTECYAMLRWARQAMQTSKPTAIHCIVPDLSASKLYIQAACGAIFDQEELQKINLSGGRRLADLPIIQTALFLFSLDLNANSLESINYLLFTPFLGGNRERLTKTRFNTALKNQFNSSITWKALFSFQTGMLEDWKKNFSNYLERRQSMPSHSLPLCYWRDNFADLLKIVAWPGERFLNSEEMQQIQHWENLLEAFSALEIIYPTRTYKEAVLLLNHLAEFQVFQAEVVSSFPIQILDPLEASGLACDKRWVMGMQFSTFPKALSPNPFLPYRLQREYGVPHANKMVEWNFSNRLMERLKASAQSVRFSYARQKEERVLYPSPFIEAIPELMPEIGASKSEVERIFSERRLEQVVDNKAPSINENEKKRLRGGHLLFQSQLNCPFQAFSRYRLNIEAFEKKVFDTAKLRGIVLHGSLEKIWNELKTHENLLTTTPAALQNMIAESIQGVWDVTIPRLQEGMEVWKSVEIHYLEWLLARWLEEEKKRPFFQVLATEKEYSVSFFKLPIRIKIDRIDLCASGEKILIDYKTGKDVSGYLKIMTEDSFDYLQIPFYCVALPEIQGAIIAQVNAKVTEFSGFSANDLSIKGVNKIDWSTALKRWSAILNNLAEAFSCGEAAVQPKKKEVCGQCDLHSFCRIDD